MVLQQPKHYVAVVGAGPAGLFGARELANAGAQVALLNRDIKPGGLAEYGIYPDKAKMKDGLRAQFNQTLSLPNVSYYGNVTVGANAGLAIEDLRGLGFGAVLVAAGAQGIKRLGIPGEELDGVYNAKDIVYHYNRRPFYSQRVFNIGQRVAVIGAGNVMLDMTHWLTEEIQAPEIIALARRGPAEAKFDRKELEIVANYLDIPRMEAELDRLRPLMETLGQDPDGLRGVIGSVIEKAPPARGAARFWLEFLLSPVRLLGDSAGRVCGVEVEENTLERLESGEIVARGVGARRVIPVDTVIFAIGDRVDEGLGLPARSGEFVKNPQPLYPVEGVSHEAYDPARAAPVAGVFLAGWARKSSMGLVGVARRDGVNAAKAILRYLEGQPAPEGNPVLRLRRCLATLPSPVVDGAALARLRELEQAAAAQRGLDSFKFDSNEEMLQLLFQRATV